MSEQQNTELALPVITEDKYPALYVSGGLDPYYQQIRNQVLSEVPDLSTKKGIARIKSLAAMVSSSKVAIEKPGREYLKQLKEMPKVIEAELRDWNQKMDALRDEVRQPVTELENKEKARIAALDQRIAAIQELGDKATIESPSAEIQLWIGELEVIVIDASWDEYQDRAGVAKDAAKFKLSSALQNRLTFEAQQAEIERLKAEQAKREQEERERQIAEKARVEAEQKALREKIEAEQREQAAKDAQAKAEQDAKDAQERLIREQQESAERERQAAERAAQQERQRQIEEQKRINYEAEQARIEAEIKAADIEHRKKVNNEALNDLIACAKSKGVELPELAAKSIISSIASGKIRHTSLNY